MFYEKSFKFLIPFALWGVVFREIFSGQSPIINDTYIFYATVKFYLDNLRLGVFPFWDPYTLLGTPTDLLFKQAMEYNPILWVMMLFSTLPINFYHAFMAVMVAYFWLGTVGVYCLTKAVSQDRLSAYVAFLVVLFSSTSFIFFTQIKMVIIFVPAVWFAFFMARFLQTFRKSFFVGAVFSLMVVLTSYLPFYTMTVLGIAGGLWLLLDFKKVLGVGERMGKFCRNNIFLLALGLSAVGVSLIPATVSFYEDRRSEVVIPSRHGDDPGQVLSRGLEFGYSFIIKTGGMIQAMDREIFSAHHGIRYDNDRYFYVSLFSYVVFLLSLLTLFNKRMVILIGTGLLLYFISLIEASAVYPFLFKHVFYFKFFRNPYFFLPFIVTVYAMVVGEQFVLILKQLRERRINRFVSSLFIVFVHLFVGWLIAQADHRCWPAYLTLMASCFFFLVFCLSQTPFTRQGFLYLWICLLVILQPLDVLYAYSLGGRAYKNTDEKKPESDTAFILQGLNVPISRTTFKFLRPPTRYLTHDDFAFAMIAMTDAPAFVSPSFGYPTRWTYMLSKLVDAEPLDAYAGHKFVLYDERWAPWLTQEVIPSPGKPPGIFIDREQENFRVIHFDVNKIVLKTNFINPKFLVYNDSYHSRWQAKINGERVKVHRANVAFKGVLVPAGEATLEFRYIPPGGYCLNYLLILFFMIFFVYFLREIYLGLRYGADAEKFI